MAEQSPAGTPDSPRRFGRPGRLAAFAAGLLVALGAVLLYGLLTRGPAPLTQRDIDDTVADALASVTPAPPFSEQVYRAVVPSLVLIETTQRDGDGEAESDAGLGSGPWAATWVTTTFPSLPAAAPKRQGVRGRSVEQVMRW
jgi:hypothetical protein